MLRERGGKLLKPGFDVAKPARSMDTNGFGAHGFSCNGGITLRLDEFSKLKGKKVLVITLHHRFKEVSLATSLQGGFPCDISVSTILGTF